MDRRIRKARALFRDMPVADVIQDMGDYLDAAADMVEQTETYPVLEKVLDLDELEDAAYDEILDAHEGLEKALGEWTGLVERLNDE